MIPRDKLVGQRILEIHCRSSLSDDPTGDCEVAGFVFLTENGVSFRIPDGNPKGGDLLPIAEITDLHHVVGHANEDLDGPLTNAVIQDIRVYKELTARCLDTGSIQLISGWFVVEVSLPPPGERPRVSFEPKLDHYDRTVSIWD